MLPDAGRVRVRMSFDDGRVRDLEGDAAVCLVHQGDGVAQATYASGRDLLLLLSAQFAGLVANMVCSGVDKAEAIRAAESLGEMARADGTYQARRAEAHLVDGSVVTRLP